MPHTLPGMDPWLEAPSIWGDFHQAFAGAMRAYLKKALPKPFYARTDSRPEIDIVVSSEPGRHVFIEIRDSSRNHQLVTLVEILSPSNKRKGKDRRSYLKNQREVLSSHANLIEIDLLRSGKRLFATAEIETMLANFSKRIDYVALISCGWKRDEMHTAFEVFPISLDEILPCIPLPLTQDIAEIALDLQQIFDEAYDTGSYSEGAVEYDASPEPPLSPELSEWAARCLRNAGVRS